jgi:hypothetical protein
MLIDPEPTPALLSLMHLSNGELETSQETGEGGEDRGKTGVTNTSQERVEGSNEAGQDVSEQAGDKGQESGEDAEDGAQKRGELNGEAELSNNSLDGGEELLNDADDELKDGVNLASADGKTSSAGDLGDESGELGLDLGDLREDSGLGLLLGDLALLDEGDGVGDDSGVLLDAGGKTLQEVDETSDVLEAGVAADDVVDNGDLVGDTANELANSAEGKVLNEVTSNGDTAKDTLGGLGEGVDRKAILAEDDIGETASNGELGSNTLEGGLDGGDNVASTNAVGDGLDLGEKVDDGDGELVDLANNITGATEVAEDGGGHGRASKAGGREKGSGTHVD